MRDYDPSLGAYIQPDPLGLVNGSAVYRYAAGNPMRYSDPTGEIIPVAGAVVVGGAIAGHALGELADYVESNNCECHPLPSSGIASAVAGASAADGSAMAIKKRFTMKGSSRGISYQSKYASRLINYRVKRRIYTPKAKWPWPRTNHVGRAVGRWAPAVGYGYAAYDLSRIVRCIIK